MKNILETGSCRKGAQTIGQAPPFKGTTPMAWTKLSTHESSRNSPDQNYHVLDHSGESSLQVGTLRKEQVASGREGNELAGAEAEEMRRHWPRIRDSFDGRRPWTKSCGQLLEVRGGEEVRFCLEPREEVHIYRLFKVSDP